MARSLGADPSHAQTTRFVRLDAVPRAERDRLRQRSRPLSPMPSSVVDDESACWPSIFPSPVGPSKVGTILATTPTLSSLGQAPLDRELFRLVTSVETAVGHDIPAAGGDWLLGELVKSPSG